MANDKIIKELTDAVAKRHSELKKIDSYEFKTNCIIDDQGRKVNIQVLSLDDLYCQLSYFLYTQDKIDSVNSELGLKHGVKIGGYSIGDWCSDMKHLIQKRSVESKKKELATIESKLDSMLSPEAKQQRELDEIRKNLGI